MLEILLYQTCQAKNNGCKMTYLRKNGIAIDVPPDDDEVWFSLDGMGTWIPNKDNFINEIEDECLKVHNNLAANIFGDLVTYYAIIASNQGLLDLLEYAGLNSESPISKIDFESIIGTKLNHSMVHQLLYLYDCRKLV
ncbi:hypothetical protein Q9292_12800 [Methylophilus sp. VKM B-3414]|uniref:hypothetical protein n=1 Tax=Methylophilus sp. VKM B-3414 TaxID=3076121 RepID=UPI0028C591D9|nr:hypothetical protein [Methylophilus sp. VKM B-3414]MDT7850490.1 hypothetical protein [Methylophilus sp. VKM B-3414]